MFTETFLLEILFGLTISFIFNIQEIVTLWYVAGLYLFLLGINLLHQEGDIFVGFLWVVDLGVGLIFLIFILHFTTFLMQKFFFQLFFKSILWIFFSGIVGCVYLWYVAFPLNFDETSDLRLMTFLISWYDYYEWFYNSSISDLNLLREMYFLNNSLEFIIINFMLFYGMLTSVIMAFWIKNFFFLNNLDNLITTNMINHNDAIYFMRIQNLITQQQQTTETRIWNKRKMHFE